MAIEGSTRRLSIEKQKEIEACARAICAGDSAAMSRLYDLTFDHLFRFTFYLSGSREAAEDLCQETYVKAFHSIQKLQHFEKVLGWMMMIARNLYVDERRSKSKQSTWEPDDLDRVLSEQAEPVDIEQAQDVRQVLARLEADDRALLLFVDLEGHSYAEVGEILQIHENLVRSRLHWARKKFKRIFKEL
jgi:RNA polymerase sigma-70 factor (ECF subfamily)